MLQESQLAVLDVLLEALDTSQTASSDVGGGGHDPTKSPLCAEVLRVTRFVLHDHSKLIDSAVELIDEQKANGTPIKCYISSTGQQPPRKCWRVPGSEKGTEYTCLQHFCPCQSYCEMSKAASPDRTVNCKHLIAVRIATVLSLVNYQFTHDDDTFVAKFTELSTQSSSSNAGRGRRNLNW